MAERGEVAVEVPDAVETGRQVDAAQRLVAGVALFGPVGIRGVAPVGAHPLEVIEPHLLGVIDQHGFVLGERAGGARVRGQGAEHAGVRGGDVPGGERGGGGGHSAQSPAYPHLTGHFGPWAPAPRGDPIGRGAGPVVPVHLPGIEPGGQGHHHRRQPGLLPTQRHHQPSQLAVRHLLDAGRGESVDGRCQTGHRHHTRLRLPWRLFSHLIDYEHQFV